MIKARTKRKKRCEHHLNRMPANEQVHWKWETKQSLGTERLQNCVPGMENANAHFQPAFPLPELIFRIDVVALLRQFSRLPHNRPP